VSPGLEQLIQDYYRRRALGERPDPEEYRERAGDRYDEFVRLLAHEAGFDARKETREQAFPCAFGPYILLGEIGRGRVGVVYEAVHKQFGRTVALKVLRTGVDADPLALRRFEREAKACSRVAHEHVVKVYEAGEHDGRPFYAMELVEGRSLRARIESGEVPGAGELAAAAARVADALHALHEDGTIHRDVKPGNLMVDDTGRMVLADFGLARILDDPEITKTGDALGTPAYASPEQLLGRRDRVDARSDVYGLAATLYEAVTSRPPFADPRETLKGRPRPPHKVDPRVPRALSDVLMKGLARRPRDRYPTAAAFADALRDPPPRRGRAAWVAGAVAAVLLATALVWWTRLRPATLAVDSVPVAQVFLDGELLGPSTARYRIRPGEHRLSLEQQGFRLLERTIELEAGEEHSVSLTLLARDEADPDAVRRLAEHFGIALTPLELETQRSGDLLNAPFAVAVLPRGDVALRELERVVVRVDADVSGNLVFRIGDEVLFDEPFDPERMVSSVPIPRTVLDRLAGSPPGTRVTWGFATTDGREALARLRLVRDDVRDLVERVDRRLEESPVAAGQLRAQLHLDAGRAYAAYCAAADVLERTERCEPACAIAAEALRRMDVEDPSVWLPLRRRIAALKR